MAGSTLKSLIRQEALLITSTFRGEKKLCFNCFIFFIKAIKRSLKYIIFHVSADFGQTLKPRQVSVRVSLKLVTGNNQTFGWSELIFCSI